jgi:hypothetical protein
MRVGFMHGCAAAIIMAALALMSDHAPAQAPESKTTRIPGGEVVSTPLAKGLWLHTEVKRFPVICSDSHTPSGRPATRRITRHEFQTFTTVGSNPLSRRSPVEHLRLTSSVGDDPARVSDCRDTEWCRAIYEDRCSRSCARGEAWNRGEHAATPSACAYVRGH